MAAKKQDPPNCINYEKTYEEFVKDIIGSNKLVVCDFFATWCAPCRKLSPLLSQLASENPDILFYKVDIDKNESVTDHFGVKSVPTITFFTKNAEGTDITALDSYHGNEISKIKSKMEQVKLKIN